MFELDNFGIPKLAFSEIIINENYTELVNKTNPNNTNETM